MEPFHSYFFSIVYYFFCFNLLITVSITFPCCSLSYLFLLPFFLTFSSFTHPPFVYATYPNLLIYSPVPILLPHSSFTPPFLHYSPLLIYSPVLILLPARHLLPGSYITPPLLIYSPVPILLLAHHLLPRSSFTPPFLHN